MMRTSMICTLHPKYYAGDQVQNSEMGGACSMYGGEGRSIQGFGGET